MMMFSKLKINQLIYIDIETVPVEKDLENVPSRIKEFFVSKTTKALAKDGIEATHEILNKAWQDSAALTPEYGKIVSIVIGLYSTDGKFKTKAINWKTDELSLLREFNDMMDHPAFKTKTFIAHNGKGFDYPWIIKRCIINGIDPCPKLWLYDKKPWEIECLDSKEIWKFGSYGLMDTSLDLLTACFDLPSPKSVMNGADVWKYFYNGDGTVNLEGVSKIGKYCSNDVISLAQAMAKMTGADKNDGFIMPEFLEY